MYNLNNVISSVSKKNKMSQKALNCKNSLSKIYKWINAYKRIIKE